MIYFDNNATTLMSAGTKKAMLEWCSCGNPSAGYASAIRSRKMMDSFRAYIGTLCGIDVDEPIGQPMASMTSVPDLGASKTSGARAAWRIVFTSGASEANCTMLQSVIDAYAMVAGKIPHVVMSAIEHRSLTDAVESFRSRGRVTVTYVDPTPSGHILAEDVENAIRANTCLVCVMHANNETGAINDIRAIGTVAHAHSVPYHCDTVQTFGKFPLNPGQFVDSFCISFHKFGGPPGVGVLAIRQQLLTGYKLAPMIFGTQNAGFRGGTENLPGIGASFTATTTAMTNRTAKNQAVAKLKAMILDGLSAAIPTRSFASYQVNPRRIHPIEIIFFGAPYGGTDISAHPKNARSTRDTVGDAGHLHNTILLSVIKKSLPAVCNTKIKLALEKKGIVISVGSACNTASPLASHVLYAMRADEYIRKGALRISLGDDNTVAETKKFITEFLLVVKNLI